MGLFGNSNSGKNEDLEKAMISASVELEKASQELEKTRAVLEHEKEIAKAKLEMQNQELEHQLQCHLNLEEKKFELEKENIYKEVELSKIELEKDAMKEAFKLETLPMQHAHEKDVQKMEFDVMMKMLDLGFDPIDFTYAIAGVSRILRNDKSDKDRKYQREIARHKLALQMQNPRIVTSTSPPSGSRSSPSSSSEKNGEEEGNGEREEGSKFNPFKNDLLDSDSDEDGKGEGSTKQDN